MRTELPGFLPIDPPSGGLARLRQALGQERAATSPWLAVATSAAVAMLAIITVEFGSNPRGLGARDLRQAMQGQERSAWVELSQRDDEVRVYVALPQTPASDRREH